MNKEELRNMEVIFTEESFVMDDMTEDSKTYQLYKSDKYHFLYELGFLHDTSSLSPGMQFLVELSSRFVHKLSRMPELEVAREETKVQFESDEADELIGRVPYVIGSEFVDEVWINAQIAMLNAVFAQEIRSYDGNVRTYLEKKSQNLKVAERIYFHLVENPEDKEFPFAFLVTYATRDSQKRIRHLPLKNALVEYGGRRDLLLALLSCLNKAAAEVPWIAACMDSGDIYHPIRLRANEMYELLLCVPKFEKCGITCRVPNWWKKRYSSVSMTVRVGEDEMPLFGFDSLLSQKPELTVNGIPLSREDIAKLLEEEDGLSFLKGQWVEVNHRKMEQLLEKVENYDGTVSLKEALTRNYGSDEDDDPDLHVTITNGKWLTSMLHQLRKPSDMKDYPLPKDFAANLRPYQKDGYNWLMALNNFSFGACLADDMGLGKTVQVIAYLEELYEQNRNDHCLLIVPASLIGNWEKELEKFAPSLPFAILHGRSAAVLEEELRELSSFLYITTYGMAMRIGGFKYITWKCVVLDEAQAIKNPRTKQTRTIKAIPGTMRIAMTGTPIENDLGNLWSLFDFLNKGLLGSSTDFKGYEKKIEDDPSYLAKLKGAISPFILRRLKTDKAIIKDLPDKMEMTDLVTLSKRQMVLYRKEIVDAERFLEEADGMERRGYILKLIGRLKQICNHPSQLIKDDTFAEVDSGKFAMLRELCETIVEKRERVLVFTQYREMCEPLAKYLRSVFHRDGYIIHGGIKPKDRTKIVEQFNDPEHYVPFVVLSLRAAGTGLNLVSANHVIHFDRWWNPAVENQASDRAFRIGQTKNVFVHKLVTEGTIEEKIDALISGKQELSDKVLTGGADKFITELSNEELMKLIRLEM